MAVVRTSKKTKKEQSSASVPTQATVPMEFRKTNEAIGLRVREGKLSLLTRKIFNVSAGTTVYLVAEATFTAGTVGAFGSLTARRVH